MRWICLIMLFTSPLCMAVEWRSVEALSKLSYIATYEKEPIEGKFQQFNVVVQANNKTAAPESLKVIVSIASADMGSDDINEAIRGDQWFDMTRFASAEFNASAIDKKDDTHYIAHGVLKLKGVEKKLDVPFIWKTDSQKASLSGEVLLKRSDFSIGSGEWASGDQIGIDVKVIFAVTLNVHK